MKVTKGLATDTYSFGVIEVVVHKAPPPSNKYMFHYHAKQRDAYNGCPDRDIASIEALKYVKAALEADIISINQFLEGVTNEQETQRL